MMLLVFSSVSSVNAKSFDGQIERKELSVTFRPPLQKEEFEVVWHVLRAIPFYQKNGYRAVLPDHKIFKDMAQLPNSIQN